MHIGNTIFTLNSQLKTTLLLVVLFNCFSLSANAQVDNIKVYYEKLSQNSNGEGTTIQFVKEEMNLVEDFSSLRQIILLRHGEPALNKKGWRTRKEAMEFIVAYDSANIYPPGHIPVQLGENEVDIIFTSTLNRSKSTAQQVFNRPEGQQPQALFREFERRIFAFPNLKLPLKWWLTGSRIFWFMGTNRKGIESFKEAKLRAKEAVVFLEKDANEKGKTLLVSHGLLNHFLKKYLIENGWTEVYDGGKGYLSQKVLVKYE